MEEKIRQSLDSCSTTRITELDPVSGRVVLDTDRPWSELLSKIETTGLRAALTGFGGSAAVSIVDKGDVPGAQGVIRFTAATPDVKQLVLDGVVDGLQPNENLHVQIHECGDVSRGCSSIGDRYGEPVGSTKTSDEGRMAFRFSDEQFSISDLIGRSVCLADDSGKRWVNWYHNWFSMYYNDWLFQTNLRNHCQSSWCEPKL